ncbi:MAG: dolichyl-diphosphooligosaccharide--protein glycosyltransferase subunit 2, partial [Nanoarchaeota archaeon]|nr:dolichyl-diphosphooligosaccharide--protein glycosyltransferase subunit 2 [Nanoarchaeota archaeon]
MRFATWGVFIILTVFLMPSAHALYTPTQPTFIPQTLSPNSSFIMYSQHPDSGSLRLAWDIKWNPLCDAAHAGLLHKSGDKWMCYFSDSDDASTCGPSPFTGCPAGETYTMGITVISATGDMSNNTFQIPVGNIELASQVTQNNGTINIKVCPILVTVDTVSYEIYASNLSQMSTSRQLTYDAGNTFCYLGNTSLDPDEYYLAFKAIQGSQAGGDLLKVVVEGAAQEEDVKITSDITYEIPDLAPTLGADTTTWTFTNGKITNVGKKTYSNLTVDVPVDLAGKMDIILMQTSLAENDTTLFTINLKNINEGIQIVTKFDLKSNNVVIAKIPLSIFVSKLGGGQVITTSSDLIEISPDPFIRGDYLLDIDGTEKSFIITNNGDQAMEKDDFGYTPTNTLLGVSVIFPLESVAPGDTGNIKVTIAPTRSGNYNGKIVLDTTV